MGKKRKHQNNPETMQHANAASAIAVGVGPANYLVQYDWMERGDIPEEAICPSGRFRIMHSRIAGD
jgi:hypothetical protein